MPTMYQSHRATETTDARFERLYCAYRRLGQPAGRGVGPLVIRISRSHRAEPRSQEREAKAAGEEAESSVELELSGHYEERRAKVPLAELVFALQVCGEQLCGRARPSFISPGFGFRRPCLIVPHRRCERGDYVNGSIAPDASSVYPSVWFLAKAHVKLHRVTQVGGRWPRSPRTLCSGAIPGVGPMVSRSGLLAADTRGRYSGFQH
jgi:hypothetical protein